MDQDTTSYGSVETVEALGELIRNHRKQRDLTLETVSGLGNVGMRFLSELERGKKTAEIGKVLKVLRTLGLEVRVVPRGRVMSSGPDGSMES